MLGRKKVRMVEEKILDVDAGMQGSLKFKDPVNLRINGRFEGHLETRGNLIIGESALVEADIIGEAIEVAGTVKGDIAAKHELKLLATSSVTGKIEAPSLTVQKGAIFNGASVMPQRERAVKDVMNLDEVAAYLEMNPNEIREWAESGRLPALREDNSWKFKKEEVDSWVAGEKV